ncbi:valyl-tRNA synthetase [Rhizobium sp. BK196]|uniref:hypothetical protein n=1 Tax=Rhizobium sp. BK196 TaxID=2587073 RepID=UPI001852FBC6|nr:hypothetical protein [Rhizobium sp. BK196]MBB3313634.1 valyl-tRNA synthetase [Rhizobium sp. BK196]
MSADPVSLIVGGLSLASGFISGKGDQAAQNYKAQQSERAAQIGKIQADQVDASYRSELNSTIANIRAIRSSAGVDPNSPTGMAIDAEQERRSDRDRIIEVGNKRMQSTQDEEDARFYRHSAKSALLGPVVRSLPAFFGS